jgi:hypothetical protein
MIVFQSPVSRQNHPERFQFFSNNSYVIKILVTALGARCEVIFRHEITLKRLTIAPKRLTLQLYSTARIVQYG